MLRWRTLASPALILLPLFISDMAEGLRPLPLGRVGRPRPRLWRARAVAGVTSEAGAAEGSCGGPPPCMFYYKF